MKKIIGLYIAIFLVVLVALSGVSGMQTMKQADVGLRRQDGGYASQVIRTENHDYVLYQNPGQTKYLIADTEIKELHSETVGTVHQNGVYYLFQYTENGSSFIGIAPLGDAKTEPAKGEEAPPIPVFEAAGDFLAAGSNEKAIFCSVLGADGRTITEYALLTGTQEWLERASFSLPEGHFAVCAAYEEDTLWLAREDGKVFSWSMVLKEAEVSVENTVLKNFLEPDIPAEGEWAVRFSCMKEAAAEMIFPAILAAAILTVLIYGIRNKNHLIFQVICCAEIIALAALLYAGYSFVDRMTREEVLETGIEAGHVLEEMRGNQRADGTVKPELYWDAMKEREGLLEDLMILDAKTEEVLLAKTLPAGKDAKRYYSESLAGLTAKVLEGGEAVMTTLEKGGREVYAVAMRDWKEMSSDSLMVAVLSEEGIRNSMAGETEMMEKIIGGLLALVTTGNAALFLFFSSRWKKFEEGLIYVAKEKKAYPDVPVLPDGMQGAWASLDDIGNSLSRLYYERDLLYRSYYKFVPKGMDILLKKPVLADIEVGDRTKIRGCMVDILLDDMKHLDGTAYLDTMTKSMELMHRARMQRDGIFLSASTDLHERKVFFEQNASRAMQFSVDLIHAYAENSLLADNDFIMMLHAAEFQYGVSGVKEMMTPYMYSEQESILEPYTKALAKAKVRIAMTEQTLRLIGGTVYTRYIGFLSGGEMVGSLKLYEGLDAYSETKRKLMMETDALFQKGLQLFYSNDFYLARNTFNEVLKLNEQDHIARWYLFHCEYHLNNPDAEVTYGLFENEVSL